ncbi:MAG: phage tail sheath family protein [Selenomonadaceae bacterium]|nr:phage tail sheath family protein [Selenomonadaceae bacterium]
MAGYRHGVYVTEKGTEFYQITRQATGITLVVGTSPIREAASPAGSNEPVLCNTYNDAVTALGYSTDTAKYTLCEAMEVLFGLYQVGPIVFVNVFDPSVHKKTVERELHLATAEHTVEIDGDVNVDDIKIEVKTVDGDDEVWTQIIPDGFYWRLEQTSIALPSTYSMGAQIYVTYTTPDVTKVSASDVAGSVNALTGKCTGLELISEVYSRFGYTVGQIIAPGFSHIAEVGLKMAAKAELINGHFSSMAIVDLPTASIGGYAQAGSVKSTLGYSSPFLTVCYPAVKYGDKVQHLSTHIAGIWAKLAASNDDIPYQGVSNQTIYMSGMCNLDGTNNFYGLEAANELNGQGIVTVTNFNGWKAWGDETSAYPSNTDPKDRWISVRSMFNFIKSQLTLNFWSKIGVPIERRVVDNVINSVNVYLSGLVRRGALLGGRLELNDDENDEQSVMDGKLTFHCYITPPSPLKEMVFVLEYDASYLSGVLSGE